MPLEFWKTVQQLSTYCKTPVFRQPFWIFLSEPEVDFENQNFSHVHAINSKHVPLEFWKSVH